MCIDLNMRMQSVLVRSYILDALCEHNDVGKKEQEGFMQALQSTDDPLGGGIKTNFESDGRRTDNPHRASTEAKLLDPSDAGDRHVE